MPGPLSATAISIASAPIVQIDGDRRAAVTAPGLAEYLMAFSMRLATACTDELRDCRCTAGPSATFDGERHAALLGDRLVQLGDVAHGAADVEALGVAFEGAGFQRAPPAAGC